MPLRDAGWRDQVGRGTLDLDQFIRRSDATAKSSVQRFKPLHHYYLLSYMNTLDVVHLVSKEYSMLLLGAGRGALSNRIMNNGAEWHTVECMHASGR